MAYSIEEKQKIFDGIIRLISAGLSLRKAIIEYNELNDTKFSRESFFEWLAKDNNMVDQYTRATEVRADAIFEEMFDIADDGTNDWVEKFDKTGQSYYDLNGEHVQRSKLRIDARKWALSKMMPKKYGDKIDVTSDNKPINAGFPTLEQFYGKVEKSNE